MGAMYRGQGRQLGAERSSLLSFVMLLLFMMMLLVLVDVLVVVVL